MVRGTIVCIIAVLAMFLSVSTLSNAEHDPLPLCLHSSAPCIHKDIVSQHACIGTNVSLMLELKLLINDIAELPRRNVSIRRGSDAIVQGFTRALGYEGNHRWKVSYMDSVSETDEAIGLLTLQVTIRNLQLEDEFQSHVEIHVRDKILKTSAMIWFVVMEACGKASPERIGTDSTLMGNECRALIKAISNCTKKLNDECSEQKSLLKVMFDSIQEIKSIVSSELKLVNTSRTVFDMSNSLHRIMKLEVWDLVLIVLLIFGGTKCLSTLQGLYRYQHDNCPSSISNTGSSTGNNDEDASNSCIVQSEEN